MRTPTLTLKRARALRRKMTLPEVLLWNELRGRKLLGLQFRHQHPEHPYVLDFYCAKFRLCVEIDGSSHDARASRDERRDAWLAEREIRVLRIPAAEVLKKGNMEHVLAAIGRAAAPSTALGGPPPPR